MSILELGIILLVCDLIIVLMWFVRPPKYSLVFTTVVSFFMLPIYIEFFTMLGEVL